MSQENVELVRRAYEAFNRGDTDEALVVLAPDFEYTTSGAIPGVTETYSGPKASGGSWLALGPVRRCPARDQRRDRARRSVGVPPHEPGAGKLGGAETSWDVWQVVRFRDGKAVRAHAFTTQEEALEAAGLSE